MENPKCTENLFGSLRGRIKESRFVTHDMFYRSSLPSPDHGL